MYIYYLVPPKIKYPILTKIWKQSENKLKKEQFLDILFYFWMLFLPIVSPFPKIDFSKTNQNLEASWG